MPHSEHWTLGTGQQIIWPLARSAFVTCDFHPSAGLSVCLSEPIGCQHCVTLRLRGRDKGAWDWHRWRCNTFASLEEVGSTNYRFGVLHIARHVTVPQSETDQEQIESFNKEFPLQIDNQMAFIWSLCRVCGTLGLFLHPLLRDLSLSLAYGNSWWHRRKFGNWSWSCVQHILGLHGQQRTYSENGHLGIHIFFMFVMKKKEQMIDVWRGFFFFTDFYYMFIKQNAEDNLWVMVQDSLVVFCIMVLCSFIYEVIVWDNSHSADGWCRSAKATLHRTPVWSPIKHRALRATLPSLCTFV